MYNRNIKTPISLELNSYLIDTYPVLSKREDFRRLFAYLAFSGNIDSETKNLVIPNSILIHFEKIINIEELTVDGIKVKDINNYIAYNYNPHKMLQEFSDQVLPFFSYRNYSSGYSDKTIRQVEFSGLSDEDNRMIKEELKKKDFRFKGNRIYFETQKNVSKESYYESRNKNYEFKKAEVVARSVVLHPIQEMISKYLNTLSDSIFAAKVSSNYEKAFEVSEKLDYTYSRGNKVKDPEGLKHRQQALLRQCVEYSKPFYNVSASGNTARLTAIGDNLLGLKREIRKALLSGWHQADLKSSQFCILSGKVNALACIELCKSGKSIWKTLAERSDIEYTPHNKEIIKNTLYPLVFGRDVEYAKRLLKKHNFQHIMKDEYLVELFSKRDEWIKDIVNNGAYDDLGNFHTIKTRTSEAIMATILQSIELTIISKAFECANIVADYGDSNNMDSMKRFIITTFLHDGFTFGLYDQKDLERTKYVFNNAITSYAYSRNIFTELEFEAL